MSKLGKSTAKYEQVIKDPKILRPKIIGHKIVRLK